MKDQAVLAAVPREARTGRGRKFSTHDRSTSLDIITSDVAEDKGVVILARLVTNNSDIVKLKWGSFRE